MTACSLEVLRTGTVKHEMRIQLIGLLAIGIGFAQTRIDLKTQSKSVDFSGASSTKPARTGVTLPAACSVGELFFKTDAWGGRNLHTCGQANSWSEIGGAVNSGCGLVGCELGQCSIDSSVVPSYSGVLSQGYVVVGAGGSAMRALMPGQPGQVLTSTGALGDPQWTDPSVLGGGLTDHAALTGLDFASSGHTGFQPVLGFTPLDRSQNLGDLTSAASARTNLGLGNAATRDAGTTAGTVAEGDHTHAGVYQPAGSYEAPLTFSAPLARSNNSVSLPVCAENEVLKTVGGAWTCAAAGGGAAVEYRAYTAAKCQGEIAGLGFSTPAANAPTPACVTGADSPATVKGVAQFADGASQSVQDHFTLAPDWTGPIDLTGKWRSGAANAGANVVWQIQTKCVADGETAGGVAWSAAQVITDGNKGTAGAENDFSFPSINTAGCAAGEEFYFYFFRDPAHASDTLGAAAELMSLRFTLRRTL